MNINLHWVSEPELRSSRGNMSSNRRCFQLSYIINCNIWHKNISYKVWKTPSERVSLVGNNGHECPYKSVIHNDTISGQKQHMEKSECKNNTHYISSMGIGNTINEINLFSTWKAHPRDIVVRWGFGYSQKITSGDFCDSISGEISFENIFYPPENVP